MDAELKAKWIEALRGGEYKQGLGYLRLRTEKFCCLGVACDLLDKDRWVEDDDACYSYAHNDEDSFSVWPPSVEKLYGLSPLQTSILWRMNDDGKSFAEIADYIEANL